MGKPSTSGADLAAHVLESAFGAVSASDWLTIDGDFNLLIGTPGSALSATVQLEKSFDGGTTARAYTRSDGTILSFTTGVNMTWGEVEAGVKVRLNCTAFAAGAPIAYRISR